MNGDGSGVEGEEGVERVATPVAHASGKNGLDDANQGQQEGNQEQAGLKVAAERGHDEGEEDKEDPTE